VALARSLASTLSYYDTTGRTWERQALIKLRHVGGDADLAREFLAAVNTTIASIRRHPEAYQLIDSTMRRALLQRFPYGIFFEIGRAEIIVR